MSVALDRHRRPWDLRNGVDSCRSGKTARQCSRPPCLRLVWTGQGANCENSVTNGNPYRHIGHKSQLICSQHRDAEPPSACHASAICDTEAPSSSLSLTTL